MTATVRTVTVSTGRAFICDASNAGYRASVSADGTVRVYDSVAGHYTTCHSLTPAQERYVRARAA